MIAIAYNNRGSAKANLKKYKEAIEDFDKAIEINPNFAEAYRGRARVKEILGDTEGARQDRKTADKIERSSKVNS